MLLNKSLFIFSYYGKTKDIFVCEYTPNLHNSYVEYFTYHILDQIESN